jgi:hypothetical protein
MRKATFGLWGMVLLAACSNTGTGGGTSGGAPEELIDEFCAKIANLSCSTPQPTEAACRAELSETRADNVADGCVAEFDAVMRCAAPQQPTCDTGVASICPSQVAALDECRAANGQKCSLFSGGSMDPGCGVQCPTYAADCNSSPSGTLECSCTEGPRIGATFAVNSCTDITSIAESNCL